MHSLSLVFLVMLVFLRLQCASVGGAVLTANCSVVAEA
jgi:hypothetical protein